MSDEIVSLSKIFDGWDGYQTSILHAIQPLSQEQLAWRPAPNLRSVGELASHIALGRINWFSRIQAPGSAELLQEQNALSSPTAFAYQKEEIIRWLEMSCQMIADTLNQWTVDDLFRSYHHEYGGKIYRVTYQWTIWRILSHDQHHGGELAIMLGMQGIQVPELGDFGGHLSTPPLAE